MAINYPFDPEFHGGCETCDELFLKEMFHYNPDTGYYTCDQCMNLDRYEQAMKVLDD